jgi:hypothetical protein
VGLVNPLKDVPVVLVIRKSPFPYATLDQTADIGNVIFVQFIPFVDVAATEDGPPTAIHFPFPYATLVQFKVDGILIEVQLIPSVLVAALDPSHTATNLPSP